jgi:hypothetical protein
LVCSSRAKRKARSTAECPLSPASIATSSGHEEWMQVAPHPLGRQALMQVAPCPRILHVCQRCVLVLQPPLGLGVTYFVISLRDSTGKSVCQTWACVRGTGLSMAFAPMRCQRALWHIGSPGA